MPRREVHDLFEETLLGMLTPMTPVMDATHVTKKSGHREDFHSVDDLVVMAILMDGVDGYDAVDLFLSGMLHLYIDELLGGKGPGRRPKSPRTFRRDVIGMISELKKIMGDD